MGFERIFGPNDEPLCLAVSTCTETSLEGMAERCRPADPTRDSPEGERSCVNFPVTAKIDFHFGNSAIYHGMLCPPKYPLEDEGIGCADALGQRVKWSGAVWTTIGPYSWFFHGHCPPLLSQPCAPTPGPTTCNPDPDRECGVGGGHEGPWGCCKKPTEDRFIGAVEEAVLSTGVTTVTDPEAFRDAVVRYLIDHGYCAVKGGPADEIGVKVNDAYNEQYDVIRGDGAAQWLHAASCSPARF